MVEIILLVAILLGGLYMSMRLSPYTEKAMSLIWEDPSKKMRLRVAKRVKELCVDGDVPAETAALIISNENNLMESQVKEMMRSAAANPAILRIAFGSRIGNNLVRVLKQFSLLGE